MGEVTGKRPPPPKWIDEDFIIKALQRNKPEEEIYVDSCIVDYANKDGSGYMSLMYRVTVKTKKHGTEESGSTTVLVKCAHETGEMKDVANAMDAFGTESLMLYDVVPRLNEYLMSVEGDLFRPLAARCLGHDKHPTDYIVLEDLIASGFKLAEAGKPLELEHCLLAVRNYGRLHAASAFLLRAEPKYRQVLDKDFRTKNSVFEMGRNLLIKLSTAASEAFKRCPGYEKYAEKYLFFPEKFYASAPEKFSRCKEECKLTVVNHGDCWKNNMMFKYSDRGLEEMRFLDFQISNTNCPAIDLTYFLYANASLEVHQHHLDRVLNEYHSTLDAILRALGMGDAADEYPREQLKKDMDDISMTAVFYALMNGFVLTSEKHGPEFAKEFSNMSCSSNTFNLIYDNPSSLSYLKYLTPIFEEKGFL